jgi:hypothetical protein
MKNLVKPFGDFVDEARYHLSGGDSPENPDRDELSAMGFDSRTELEDTDAIADAIDEHFNQNTELNQKWREFEETLTRLTRQFADQYSYDSSDLSDAADTLSEYGIDQGYPMDVAISQAIQKGIRY